jgi:anti-sigma factor RsiW
VAKKRVDASVERRSSRKDRTSRGERSITTVKADKTEQENFQRWVNDQLRKLYDPVLDEPIPESMLELLRKHRRSR